MTISSTARLAGPYTGTGLQSTFGFRFKVFQPSDLLVVQTGTSGNVTTLTLNSQYSVTLNSNQDTSPGGTISTVAPLPAGYTLVISSQLPVLQSADLTNAGNFYPQVINNALDYLTVLIQQLQIGRAISVPEVTNLPLLPSAAARANLLLGFDSNGNPVATAPASGSVAAFATSLISSIGSTLVGLILSVTGAVSRTLQSWIGDFPVTPQSFGAKGDGTTLDDVAFASFCAALAAGRAGYIPWTANGYLLSQPITIQGNLTCDGQLIAQAGFAGKFVSIVNSVYGRKLRITGLNVYSTDVRPSPYGGAATVGIYVGPDATHLGSTPCPNVTLYNCKAQRFSIGRLTSSYNITDIGGEYVQNDHNYQGYTTDTSYNQINDLMLVACDLDSAATSVGGTVPYALRIGTTGLNTYASAPTMGVNLVIKGCNFDGAPVFIDNMSGVSYHGYHEQAAGYTYTGGAVVLGSAGASTLQNFTGEAGSTFVNFAYAWQEVNAVAGLHIRPCWYDNIAYSALQAVQCEAFGFRYENGVAGGSTNWAAPYSEVCTNFSAGSNLSQAIFGGISIFGDYLAAGSQLAPSTAATTNWYPSGRTNDGRTNVSSANGRFRSASVAKTGIAVTQSGNNISFNVPAQALYFNGGDQITGANGATWIKSINYAAGTAVVDGSGSGATTISHAGITFRSRIEFASAAPTTGTWLQGDFAWNSAPTATGVLGWACTTAGTPGTWTGVTIP